MENERWFRVPRGGGVREIEKMEDGESPYYYTNSHYGVITGSGSSSSSSQSHGMISMSMPPPPSTLMVSSSYAAAAAAADHDQTHYYYFGSSQLPFTNMINPAADHETSHSQKEEYDEMRMKAKVMAHPLFPRLLASYLNCHKINEFKAKLQVGAPAEVVVRLEHAASSAAAINSNSQGSSESTEVDPELDQFMEAYCEMLAKYHEELTKPFHDAMLGLSQINSHLNNLSCTSFSPSPASTGNLVGQMGTSEEAQRTPYADPRAAEDSDIKAKLLKKYGGCLGSLSQELKEKKKTGKLPKEARAKLQEWWSRHYTWPYPSEPQKLWLAASAGLTVKQINNWFINQRKRHWKPSSEGIQLAMADHHLPRQLYYMDHLLCNPSPLPMDCTSTPLL